MPRIKKTPSPLKDLLAALNGAPAGDHQVCEFSCSCCKSSITAAADALCTYLSSNPPHEALQAFMTNSGPAATDLALNSSNELMVCAALRVVGALLQNIASSKTPLQWQQQQLECEQINITAVDAPVSQQSCSSISQSYNSDEPANAQQQLSWLDQSAGMNPGSFTVCHGLVDSSQSTGHTAAVTAIWCRLLQQLINRAASPQQPATARIAALKELHQLLLLLLPDSTPAAYSTACAAGSNQHDTVSSSADGQKFSGHGHSSAAASCSSSSSSYPLQPRGPEDLNYGTCMLDSSWLFEMMQCCFAALQDTHQDVRRAGSQALAAAVMLQQQRQ